ncbi:MAG: hypothetical protein KDD58_12385 [Bdellovibrionales bacterium]|nr:hypothetical protein [Bdellovibrionales bacterium]
MALFLCLNLFSLVSEASEKLYEFYLCSNKKVVRSLRIELLEDSSCQTTYSKAGIDKVIGSGMHIESCQKFLNNVKGNLEAVGWECRKIDSVNISEAQ